MQQYTELELQLIEECKKWRQSKGFEQSMTGYDNTPFILLSDGCEARAILKNDAWIFRVIARHGYTGLDCKTLQESMDHALQEKEECEKRLDEIIRLSKLKNQ